MLPKRCIQPPCMNMAVKIVTDAGAGLSANSAGMNAHCRDELVAAGKLEQEHQHVEADQDEGDDRGGAPLRVVVADREHASLPFAGSNPR